MTHEEERFIVEFQQVGNSIKVTAFDPVTLQEAVIVGAVGATRDQLAQLAVRKLLYILKKDQ